MNEDRKNRALRIADGVVRLLPALAAWVRDRLESDESEEDIRRDIQDRRAKIAENRRKRDAEFEEKFGRPPGDPWVGIEDADS